MKRKHISFIIFALGILIFAYPWISRPFSYLQESNAVDDYYDMVEGLSPELEEELVGEYEYYNDLLAGEDIDGEFVDIDEDYLEDTAGDDMEMEDLENIDGEFDEAVFSNGRLLGTVMIPKLNLQIPIYQGATVENLRHGVAQISGTSLPTGEIGTHSVIAGHNRLRNKKLFTTIHKLKKGDLFKIDSLGKEMDYKIVDMKVVEPYETDYLMPVEGKDKVTLLTCSYFGKKRLLVMGERKE